jgi:hypothetical protein
MKTSEAFKQAKQCLYPIGRAKFICHALAEAAYTRDACSAGFDWQAIHTTRKSGFKTAIKVITDRIGSDAPLESWLAVKGIEYSEQEPDQMMAHRHAWLDLLIAEFEAKGD